jgi:hypothetical protein
MHPPATSSNLSFYQEFKKHIALCGRGGGLLLIFIVFVPPSHRYKAVSGFLWTQTRKKQYTTSQTGYPAHHNNEPNVVYRRQVSSCPFSRRPLALISVRVFDIPHKVISDEITMNWEYVMLF